MDIIDTTLVSFVEKSDHLFPDETEIYLLHAKMDDATWRWAYNRGYRDARYAVPAQILVCDIHTVEVIIYALDKGSDDPFFRVYRIVAIWDQGEPEPFYPHRNKEG